MQISNNTVDYYLEASKLAPPAAVSGITAAGIALEDWAYIVTIIYTLMMIASLIYKFVKGREGKFNG